VDDLIKRAPPALQNLFFDLRSGILKLGDDVREKVGGWYCDYRKSSTFATVVPQSKNNRLLIYIKMGDKTIEDPQKLTSPIPPSYGYGKLNTQFKVSKISQLGYAMQLIKQAYDYVP
jgi:predicted transport protein